MSGREYVFGVFVHGRGQRGWKLRCYTRYYNAEWPNFLGEYRVMGSTRREAIAAARSAAMSDLDAGKRPLRVEIP